MRILHILHNSLPLICGYSIRSNYIVSLERSMGLETAVVTSGQHPNGDAARETIEGVDYRRTPAPGGSQLPFVRELNLVKGLERQVEIAARDFQPDVIHAHSPVLVGLPALRVGRRLRIPVVYEIRDLWENASVDRGRFGAGSPLYKLARGLEGYVLKNADAVVTICDLLKTELMQRSGVREVHVVPNGVDSDVFLPRQVRPDLQERWNLQGKEILLYAGTFQPYEGLDLLVRAIGPLVKQRPHARLVIAGGSAGFAGATASISPDEQRLRTLAQDLGVQDHVTFTGRLPHAEVRDLYALSDVVCFPRTLTLTTALTTPLKPLEALSMARSVITSDVPPMKELVHDGVTGLHFRAGDCDDLVAKCLSLLSDPALRQRLGETARTWVVENRQWATVVSRYQSVYESALFRAGIPAKAAS